MDVCLAWHVWAVVACWILNLVRSQQHGSCSARSTKRRRRARAIRAAAQQLSSSRVRDRVRASRSISCPACKPMHISKAKPSGSSPRISIRWDGAATVTVLVMASFVLGAQSSVGVPFTVSHNSTFVANHAQTCMKGLACRFSAFCALCQQRQIDGSRLRTATEPIEKRINWFADGRPEQESFLLQSHRDISDGLYFCCGGLSFFQNGSVQLGNYNKSRIQMYRDAGLMVMPTFGGDHLPLAAWEKRTENAAQILQWVLEHNFTGVHNDWESHNDLGVDAYKFYDFWGEVASHLHRHGRIVGTCVETAPGNISHPWYPRALDNDTYAHSYMFNWDYPLSLRYMDIVTNMATYPMMHTTDGNNSWCKGMINTTWCANGCEDFVDHLTPAFKYLESEQCDPTGRIHTVAQWCGLKGQVQDMLDAGADAASGQLSPGIWMNNCHRSAAFPGGITAQGWTQESLRSFLDYLDTVGVRSIDMWTSMMSANDMDTCDWFLLELRRWRHNGK